MLERWGDVFNFLYYKVLHTVLHLQHNLIEKRLMNLWLYGSYAKIPQVQSTQAANH